MEDFLNFLDSVILECPYSKGCTEKEIRKIESSINHKLPFPYRIFLARLGKFTCFLEGESCFYDDIFALKIEAKNLLKHNFSTLPLKENDFVFYMSQGILFAFFNLDDGNNPPVYYFMEGTNQKNFKLTSSTFTEFIYKRHQKSRDLFR